MDITRRQLLAFFGITAAQFPLSGIARAFGQAEPWNNPSRAYLPPQGFTPVRLPHDLNAYSTSRSYLPSNGTLVPAGSNRLAQYSVVDDVIVPPEFERYVIVAWGDRLFADPQEYVGYNCDYTAFTPINGHRDGYLWINHEYVSFPISDGAPETPGDLVDKGFPTTAQPVLGFTLDKGKTTQRFRYGEFMYNQGGSVVRIRKGNDGRYVAQQDPANRRYHGLSGLGLNAQRTDAYKTITSWGPNAYQQGDDNYLVGTGPAAVDVFPKSSDGLGNRIIGTAFNCSGGQTPWGTILSCEENFQGAAAFFVGVTEAVKPDGTQIGYTATTTGAEFGLVGEKYGWVAEVDVAEPAVRAKKHTALGRFRHENVALRLQPGKPLVAYMGDDRRGGHTWKFVSSGVLANNLRNKGNSALFEDGTLYVARFDADGTGQWIPLVLSTPTNPIPPTVLSSVEFAALGAAQRDGLLPLPRRNGIAGQTIDGGAFGCTRTNQGAALPGYQNKTLANFYATQGALLCDAFLAANLAGGTPTARPEDIEVNPYAPREVIIAYTDGAPGGDGYPDSRIFQVAKLSTAVNATQQSGGLYKIVEDDTDSLGLTFRWQRLKQGGEEGALECDGFANVDNLGFDQEGNIWGVTDMSTNLHNGFNVGAAGTPQTINHAVAGNAANLVGVFGANWMFVIPATGPNAGQVVPFAQGPVRCEMTGPTFVGDTLIVSVQHPGEDCPIGDGTVLSRSIEMLATDGTLYTQVRSVPRGSNWPSGGTGVPKPAVIGITQRRGREGKPPR